MNHVLHVFENHLMIPWTTSTRQEAFVEDDSNGAPQIGYGADLVIVEVSPALSYSVYARVCAQEKR